MPEHDACEFNWHGIPKLPHVFRPRTKEQILVWECLDSRRLANSKVANRTVWEAQHVFSTWNAMVASFQCLRWFIKRAASMTGIDPRAGLQNVIGKPDSWCFWLTQIRNGVTNSSPRQELASFQQNGLGEWAEAFFYPLSIALRHLVTLPIIARDPQFVFESVARMRRLRERPLHVQIRTNTDDEHAFPLLGHAVIRCVQNAEHGLVMDIVESATRVQTF